MRVKIDSARCTGNAMCWAAAPEVFAVDDDGYGFVATGRVAGELLDKAELGAGMCPEHAIEIVAD